MPPSSVAKCMTTNYYAIIYDHDHSKHINDHLRCRQDNGATCLNCKVDFSLEMLTTTTTPPHRSSPLLSSTPLFYFWNASRLGQSLSSSAHLSFTLPVLTGALSIYLSLCESFTVPWYDQRQLCDTVWGIQEAENIKPLKSNLQKKNKNKKTGTEAHMQRSECVFMCVCDKQMN